MTSPLSAHTLADLLRHVTRIDHADDGTTWSPCPTEGCTGCGRGGYCRECLGREIERRAGEKAKGQNNE